MQPQCFGRPTDIGVHRFNRKLSHVSLEPKTYSSITNWTKRQERNKYLHPKRPLCNDVTLILPTIQRKVNKISSTPQSYVQTQHSPHAFREVFTQRLHLIFSYLNFASRNCPVMLRHRRYIRVGDSTMLYSNRFAQNFESPFGPIKIHIYTNTSLTHPTPSETFRRNVFRLSFHLFVRVRAKRIRLHQKLQMMCNKWSFDDKSRLCGFLCVLLEWCALTTAGFYWRNTQKPQC